MIDNLEKKWKLSLIVKLCGKINLLLQTCQILNNIIYHL
jgi:hypothetical protein